MVEKESSRKGNVALGTFPRLIFSSLFHKRKFGSALEPLRTEKLLKNRRTRKNICLNPFFRMCLDVV